MDCIMYSNIPNLIPSEVLKEVQSLLERLQWEDGKKTARGIEDKKNNEQITITTPGAEQLIRHLATQINGNSEIKKFAKIKRVSRLMFGRYFEGAFYETHTDAAFQSGGGMGEGRADISFTVFLNSPKDYQGGELILESSFGEVQFKEEAGSAVFYDSGLLHRVNKVTKGTRLVIIGWCEAWVPDTTNRADLRTFLSIQEDYKAKHGKDEFYFRLLNLRSNLERKYAN